MNMRKTFFTALGVAGMTLAAMSQKISEVKFLDLKSSDVKENNASQGTYPVLSVLRGNDTLNIQMLMFEEDIQKQTKLTNSDHSDRLNPSDAAYVVLGSSKPDTVINGKTYSKVWIDSYRTAGLGEKTTVEDNEKEAKKIASSILEKQTDGINPEPGNTSNFVWVPKDKLQEMFGYNKDDAFRPGKYIPVKVKVNPSNP